MQRIPASGKLFQILFAGAQLGFLFQIVVVLAQVLPQAVRLQFQNASRDLLQEIPVVGNHDDRPREFQQSILEDFLAVDVQMVGGLVQDQGVGSAKHHFQQRQPGFLAAGQAPHLQKHVFPAEQETSQNRPHLGIRVQPVRLFQLFQYRVPVVEQELPLVVVAEGHVVARLQVPLAWRDFTQQNPQQRGFSHPVGSHDADFFAPLDVKIHAREQIFPLGSVAEVLRQALCLQHIVSGLEVLFEMDLHAAGFGFRTFQAFQGFQPFFPGLGPLGKLFGAPLFEPANHVLLPGNLTLLIVVGPQLRFPADPLLLGKGVVVAVIAGQMVVFHFEDPVDDLVEEVPVVGNHHDGAFVAGQVLLQPFQGSDVQMVGGLVQHQQVRLFQQQGGQGQAGALPS